jgi:hypothetical protein
MTSMMRRIVNPGKREREARKRHRRGQVFMAPMTDWLKLGHKHFSRFIGSSHLTVADAEKPGTGKSVMSLSATPVQLHKAEGTDVCSSPQHPSEVPADEAAAKSA